MSEYNLMDIFSKLAGYVTNPAKAAIDASSVVTGVNSQDMMNYAGAYLGNQTLAQKYGEDYTKFTNKLEAHAPLKNALSGMFSSGNESSASDATAKIETVKVFGGMGQKDPDVFKKLNNLVGDDDAVKFMVNVSQNDALKSMFVPEDKGSPDANTQAAIDSAVSMVNKMDGLKNQDPDVFKKLNTILGMEGAGEFLNDPAVRDITRNMVAGNEADPAASIAMINGLYDVSKDNPQAFVFANQIKEKNPEMFNGMVEDFKNDPEGATKRLKEKMENAQQMEQTLGQLGINPEQLGPMMKMMSSFVDKLEQWIPGIKDFFTGMIGDVGNAFGFDLNGMMGIGNNGGALAAAAGATTTAMHTPDGKPEVKPGATAPEEKPQQVMSAAAPGGQ